MDTGSSDPVAVYGMYRLYTVADPALGVAHGERLYVGITSRPFVERWREEAERAPTNLWWPLVDPSATETVLLNGGNPMRRVDAETVEAEAIAEYDPVTGRHGTRANHIHNGGAGAELASVIESVYGPGGMGGHSPVYVGDPPLAAALRVVGEYAAYAAAALIVVVVAVISFL